MNDPKEFNENAMKVFRESQEGQNTIIVCILTIGDDGKARIFQSSAVTPKELSQIFYQLGDQIIARINNIKQNPINMKIQIAIEVPDELVNAIIKEYELATDPERKPNPKVLEKKLLLADSIRTMLQLTIAKELQLKLKNIFSKINP
jgi:hypothetical protein